MLATVCAMRWTRNCVSGATCKCAVLVQFLMMLVISILPVLVWKTASYIDFDFVLLRWLGVPWQTRR